MMEPKATGARRAKHTPGPWRTGPINYADVYGPAGDVIALVTKGRKETVDDVRLIVAAPDLLEAAKLQVLNFQRSDVSGNFLGDDDHEAWRALSRAIAKAEPARGEGGEG